MNDIKILKSEKNDRLTISDEITLKIVNETNLDLYLLFVKRLMKDNNFYFTARGKLQVHNNQVKFSSNYGLFYYCVEELKKS